MMQPICTMYRLIAYVSMPAEVGTEVNKRQFAGFVI